MRTFVRVLGLLLIGAGIMLRVIHWRVSVPASAVPVPTEIPLPKPPKVTKDHHLPASRSPISSEIHSSDNNNHGDGKALLVPSLNPVISTTTEPIAGGPRNIYAFKLMLRKSDGWTDTRIAL